jgi:hypothetical protein
LRSRHLPHSWYVSLDYEFVPSQQLPNW